jgi:hypothetical protein
VAGREDSVAGGGGGERRWVDVPDDGRRSDDDGGDADNDYDSESGCAVYIYGVYV